MQLAAGSAETPIGGLKVAAAWTVRSHTLKAPRTARTGRGGGRIWDLREILKIQYTVFFYLKSGRVGGLFGTLKSEPSLPHLRWPPGAAGLVVPTRLA
jgi:hypothetical protein